MQPQNQQNPNISPTEMASRQKDFEARCTEFRIRIAAVCKEFEVDIRPVQRISDDQSALRAMLQYFDTRQWDKPGVTDEVKEDKRNAKKARKKK